MVTILVCIPTRFKRAAVDARLGDAAREVRTTRVELDSSFELQVGRGSGSRRGDSGETQVQYHAANMAQSVSGANIEGVKEE